MLTALRLLVHVVAAQTHGLRKYDSETTSLELRSAALVRLLGGGARKLKL